MTLFRINLIGLQTLATKEVIRIARIWVQSLVPPIITTLLYFMIFGHIIGKKIGTMHGTPYIQYITPGLIMMAVITNAYTNTCSSFFGAKFNRSVDELLVSPLSPAVIILGYCAGTCFRVILVGILVSAVALYFTPLHAAHPWVIATIILLTTLFFSLTGLINAIFAKKFDDVSLITTFIITPMTYLGGVFYSIQLLPSAWQTVARFNPILYIINGMRYGMLGISDIHAGQAISMLAIITVAIFLLCWWLIARGIGLRN